MKKLTLLLIPALLVLTSCKNEPVTPASSSGELPSSESSSEEPAPTIPTPRELMSYFTNDSYALEVTQAEYGIEDEPISEDEFTLHKEGDLLNTNLEILAPYEEEGLRTLCFANVKENADVTYYYQVGENWIKEPFEFHPRRAKNPLEVVADLLMSTYDLFADIEVGEQFAWTYDEENAIYHGNDGEGVYVTLELCLGFFSTLEVEVNFEDDHMVTTVNASGHKSTRVVLPETPVSEMFDAIYNMYSLLDSCYSYTVSCNYSYIDNDATVTRNYLYKLVRDDETGDMDIKLVVDNDSAYYYRRDAEENKYYWKAAGGEWTEFSEDEFYEAVSGAFEVFDFLSCPDQEVLAAVTSEIVECVPGSFSFVMIPPRESLSMTRTISCTYDTDTYEIKTYKEETADYTTLLTFSNINNTIID